MNYENLNEETRMAIHNEWLDISYKLGINSEDGKFSISDIRKAFYAGINSVLKRLGWHPASELPVIPEGKFSVSVIAYCNTPSGIYAPVEIAYTITGGWQYESVKWWCYPPKED